MEGRRDKSWFLVRGFLVRVVLSGVFLAAGAAAAAGQGDSLGGAGEYAQLDRRVRNLPGRSGLDGLAEDLSGLAEGPWEKTRAIYVWLTENIAYDTRVLGDSRFRPALSPEDVLRQGRSVCSGYSRLFEELGERMGLRVVSIAGFGKGWGYRPGQSVQGTNHEWTAVQLEGEWRLFDATWGSGYADDQGRFRKRFDEVWFDTDPEFFALSHYPEEDRWQLLEDPMSRGEFRRAAFVPHRILHYGFSREAIVQAAKKEDFPGFPTVFDMAGRRAEAVDVPLRGTLKAGEEAYFRVRVEAQAVKALNKGEYHDFTAVEGAENLWELTVVPRPGRIILMANRPEGGRRFDGFLAYRAE